MSPLRSDGWSVAPSFVPHGPTSPVTLLVDEEGLTQLAGDPAVAWQTPWAELGAVTLVRRGRGMVLAATVAGVRYRWRNPRRADYGALAELVSLHGGRPLRRGRRLGVSATVAVVLVASVGGTIGAWLNRSQSGAAELADARSVNLTLNDLPSGWTTFPYDASPLQYLFTKDTQVVTSTPTTVASTDRTFNQIAARFQRCMDVTNATDRVYGAAGQEPAYQVTSPIFNSTAYHGIEVASTTQYYATTTMVHRDVAEMSRSPFGACFVTSQAAILEAVAEGTAVSKVASGTDWQPLTFVHGWSSGGAEAITLPGATEPLTLVMVVTAAGHYEVTMGAIVSDWAKSKLLLAGLVNTLLARMTSPASTSA